MSPTANADLFLREVVFMSKPAPPYQSTISVMKKKYLEPLLKGYQMKQLEKLLIKLKC